MRSVRLTPPRVATVARLARRRVRAMRRNSGRRANELAFLPAALEIAETPPSPVGRAIGATIILLFCVAVTWAWAGTTDIVAATTGKIVPSDSRLEIEAMISNRDIGFVHAGQEAEIKIDTFSFTRYGLLRGTVLTVSQDAVIRDRRQDRADDRALGTQNDTSEPKGQELNYSARISLDRTRMQIDDRVVDLSPGMAATVEIKTGSRTILSYLLSPLLRYRQEALHER